MKKYKTKMNSLRRCSREYSREKEKLKKKLKSEMTKIIRDRYFKIRKKKMKIA